MKNVTVVIPTRNRIEKCEQTIKSIPEYDWLKIWVVCDNDEKSALHFGSHKRVDNMFLVTNTQDNPAGAVFCRNKALETIDDGVICATDDIEFIVGAIEWAFDRYQTLYPDDDGVLGFIQEGVTPVDNYHPAGVCLVGINWLAHYPDQHMYCPQYFHFSCQEIKWLADKLGKFTLGDLARLYHWHPAFNKQLADTTHVEARAHKVKDMALIKERRDSGLIWGDS